MKYAWHTRKGADTLILFCNGWGMDHHPFIDFPAQRYDVVILYDYRDLSMPEELEEILAGYVKRELVCWSFGVWAGLRLFCGKEALFHTRIAINGTLLPIHDDYGIPVQIYDNTLAKFDREGRDRFYRRMCREPGVLSRFIAVQPRREISDQKEELACFQTMVTGRGEHDFLYTDVILSENDLVIPTAHQRNFWHDHQAVISIAGCHFPFFRWQSWDELLELVSEND